MDKKTLETIKDKLLAEKERLETELASFSKKSDKVENDYDAEFPDLGSKEDENALEVTVYSDRLSLERNMEQTLQDVIKALDKIEKNDYGICKYCGKPIDDKRLLARPESSACITCKTELQSRPKIA